MSLYRTYLAVVSAQFVLTVIDLRTQECVFTKNNVSSVCFNSEVNNMLCYTTSSTTSLNTDTSMFVVSGIGLKKVNDGYSQVKTGQPQFAPPLEQLQHITGPAIGFQAQKIYSLHRGMIVGIDVPHSDNMRRALDIGDIKSAYSVACLGATEADWKVLAMNALRANSLDIAKNCFARLKDTKYLGLIEAIERGDTHTPSNITDNTPKSSLAVAGSTGAGSTVEKKSSGRIRGVEATPITPQSQQSQLLVKAQCLDPSWQAELLAYEGFHQEAAKTFSRAGKLDEAIRMLTDLRRWEDAKLFAQNAGQSDHSGLIVRQAKWLQEINDWKGEKLCHEIISYSLYWINDF